MVTYNTTVPQAQGVHGATSETGAAHGERAERQRILDALLETFGGFLLLYAINLIWFPEDLGFVDQTLHPYFVVVLLVAARYGTLTGFIAGLVASLLYLVFLYADVPLSRLGEHFQFAHLLQPYLFMTIGVVLGELRQMAQEENDNLAVQATRAERQLGVARSEVQELRRANFELKERVAASTETVGSFYEAASRAEALDRDTIPAAVLEIVERFCGSTTTALYHRTREGFRLDRLRGPKSSGFPEHLPAPPPALEQMMRTRGVVGPQDCVARELAAPPYMLAAPMFEGAEPREITRLLVIHEIPFERLIISTRFALRTIADWASLVLQNAEAFDELESAVPVDRSTGALKPNYLERQIDLEWERARRYDVDLTVIYARLDGIDQLAPEVAAEAKDDLARILTQTTRAVDIVGRLPREGDFAMLLPSTAASKVYPLLARVQETFAQYVRRHPECSAARLRFGLGTFEPDQKKAEDMVAQAERFSLRRST